MPSAVVLGAGMVGSVMAADLARDGEFDVTVVDARAGALGLAQERTGGKIRARCADLSDSAVLREVVEPADVVLGALSSSLGFRTLKTMIEAGKPYCDISFMPENAWELDAMARERGVTAVADCGVAPGMSNLLAGYGASLLDECSNIEIYVGGLPRERRWPFEYKAAFSPRDVIEEYTRPARIVERGEVVVREALSEPELMDFPGVGTLEAFNTDGLRSLAYTLDVPNMKEKTLRYPGHIGLMRAFRETGLFGSEAIEVNGATVRPIDVTSALMFPKWTYEEGEEDLTVMRVIAEGVKDGKATRHVWDMLDVLDPATGFTSMARTTAFPCTIFARLLSSGRLTLPGVVTLERIGRGHEVVEHVLAEHDQRGVRYVHAVLGA